MRTVNLALALCALLALTGCEELTNQRRIGEDARTQRQQQQITADANEHRRDLEFRLTQSREAGRLQQLLAKARQVHEQIQTKAKQLHEQLLRDKRHAFLAPVLKFLSVVFGLALIVILGIKMYFIHKLQLADVDRKLKEMRTKAKISLELRKLANAEYWKNYPQLSQAQQEATLERLLPPAQEAA